MLLLYVRPQRLRKGTGKASIFFVTTLGYSYYSTIQEASIYLSEERILKIRAYFSIIYLVLTLRNLNED